MLKKRWIALAGVAVASTTVWSWAGTVFQLQTKLANTGGTLQVRNYNAQTVPGTVFKNFTTSAAIPVEVKANDGYYISSLTQNGSNVAITNNLDMSATFQKSNGTLQSLVATFSASKLNITTASAGNSTGLISPSTTTVAAGGNVTLTATPKLTYGFVTGVTVNGVAYTGASFPNAGPVAINLTNVKADQNVVVSFDSVSVNAGTNKVGVNGTAVTLRGSATGTGTTTWTELSGPATVSLSAPNSLTTSFTPSVDGTYVFQLADVVAGKTLATSTVQVTVVDSAITYMNSSCNGCHNANGGAVPSSAFNSWSSSYHKSANVTCVSCHTDGAMPTPVNTATVDAQSFVVTGATAGTVGNVFCSKCHSSAAANLPAISAAAGTWHSQQPNGASNCSKCHGTPHDAKNDVNAICSSCHNGEAADFFVKSPHWNNLRNDGDSAVAGDQAGTCATNKCHFRPTTNAKVACAACHSTGGANNGGDHIATSGSLHDPQQVSMEDSCWACHEGSHHGTPTAEYQKSAHYLNPYYQYGDKEVVCQDCHNPHSTEAAFPAYDATSYKQTAAGACDKCHTGQYGVFNADGTMKGSHSSTKVAAAAKNVGSTNAGWYTGTRNVFYNISSSYVTPQTTCSDCHGHNNYVNAEYADTMHGDKYGRWKGADYFKYRGYSSAAANPSNVGKQDGCVRCHTTTGFQRFVDSGFQDLRAWGFANTADTTAQVIACSACHVTGKGAITGEAEVGLPEGNVNGWNPNSIRANGKPFPAYYNYSIATTGKFVTKAQYSDFKESNVCVPCHSGRNTATNGNVIKQLAAFQSFTSLTVAGGSLPGAPHGVYQAAILDGKIGYQFSKYTTAANGHATLGVGGSVNTGTVAGPCVTCHMDSKTQVGENGKTATYRKHSFEIVDKNGAVPAVCSKCHSTTFAGTDLDDAKAKFVASVDALAQFAASSNNKYGKAIVTLSATSASPADAKRIIAGVSFTGNNAGFADLAGAVYNIKLLMGLAYGTTDVGAYAHNPQYLKQLVSDTFNSLLPAGQSVATAITALPTVTATTTNPGFTADQQNQAAVYLNNVNNHYAAANAAGYKVQYMVGSANCATCHNPQESQLQKEAREAWAASEHGQTSASAWTPGSGHLWRNAGAAGVDFQASIPKNDCQRCHTADGYVQFVGSNMSNITPVDTAANAVTNSPLNCNTCHTNNNFDRRPVVVTAAAAYGNGKTYASYPAPDSAVGVGVSTFYNISTVDNVTKQSVKVHLNVKFPDVGESNMCNSCHSARVSGAALVQAANAGLSMNNAGFQNSHYLGASGLMYMKAGFTAFVDPSTVIGSTTYGKTLTSSLDMNGGVSSTHRNLGTPAIVGDHGMVAGNLDSNGPCVTCHMKGYTAADADRPGAGHSLEINADAYNQVCINCHTSEGSATGPQPLTGDNFLQKFVEPNQSAFNNSLNLAVTLLQSKYNIKYDSAKYPYFYDLSQTGTPAVTDWTRGGSLSSADALKLHGACLNINLLSREPAAFVHARTYVRRLVYDTIDFLDDGVINLSVATTAAQVDPTNFGAGTNAYSDGTLGTFDAGTTEGMLYLKAWDRTTGKWISPERP